MKTCRWYRKFDGHYSMDCTDENGKRANGNFHPYIHDKNHQETKWHFKYCPYCGGEIAIEKMEGQ